MTSTFEPRDPSRHLESEEIALLAEGHMAPAEAERLHLHLATCRSCLAAYADVVRYRAAWLAQPEQFEGADPTVHDVRPPGLPEATPATRGSGSSTALFRWSLAASLVAAAVVVASVLFRRPAPLATTQVPPAIAAALERESSSGLVLPGGEAGAARDRDRYRGVEGQGPELQREVDSCLRLYEGGRRNTQLGYATGAGLLALGQLDAAREYANDALRRANDDPALLTLSADIALRSNDLTEAERRARQALSRRPTDPVLRLNLAIVLREMGRKPEADRLLGPLANEADFAPIQERARRMLDSVLP